MSTAPASDPRRAGGMTAGPAALRCADQAATGLQRLRWSLAAALSLLLAACSNPGMSDRNHAAMGAAAPATMAAEAAADGGGDAAQASFLAYEHTASITLPADAIGARMQEAQQACTSARFGACVVLNVRRQGGDWPSGTLGVRIAPQGVEPMIELASAGADLGSRSTHAEDLAVLVRDNDLARERLAKERERLQEFAARRDLAVADMIALSRQLADTEAQLERAERAAGQHRRRIETQLLTLEFRPTATQANRNEIWLAIRDSGPTLALGVAWTIRALAFALPLLALIAVVLAWRRRSRRRRQG